jgi:hypothetical protein
MAAVAAHMMNEKWFGIVAMSFVTGFASPASAHMREVMPHVAVQRIPSVTNLASHPAPVAAVRQDTVTAVMDTAEMVRNLRQLGLPILTIAQIAHVERKTIYSWLDGAKVQDSNAKRMELIHGLLTEATGGESPDLRNLRRFWDRSIPGVGASLGDLLSAEMVDTNAVRTALEVLRPAVARAAERELRMAGLSSGRQGNAYLDEMPEATTERG